MYCHHCGAKLPDNAKFCPECGGKTILQQRTGEYEEPTRQAGSSTTDEPPKPQRGDCLVTRKSGPVTLRKTQVIVDGDEMGQVAEGETLCLSLQEGEHILRLQTGRNSIETVLYIGPDATAIVEFKTDEWAKERHKILRNSFAPANINRPGAGTSYSSPKAPVSSGTVRLCPKCGGAMTIQTVSESRKAGCGTILLYIILCLTILGILIVIPLALRKKTETVTYAVCQNCGHRERRGSLL